MDVIITRQPRNYIKQGVIDISYISDIHWDDLSGGVKIHTSDKFLYGYIPYEMAINLVDCSGEHSEGYRNNLAKICILKGLNQKNGYAEGYQECRKRADEQPSSYISQNRSSGEPPCTKKIIHVLDKLREDGKKEVKREALKKIIVNELGYPNSTFCSAMKTLVKENRIKTTSSTVNHNQVIILEDSE